MISKLFTHRGAKKSRSRSRRTTTSFAIYGGLLVVLIVLVSTGYRTPDTDAQVNNAANQSADVSSTSALPVVTPGEAQSANLASVVAVATNLSAADSVANKSVSMSASVALDQPDATSVSKPQIADPTVSPEPLIAYTVQEGDTAATIASKFNVSDQTVRWANNLASDSVTVGSTVTVPVVDGVVYTVKDGENLNDVATRYKSDVDSTVALNNLTGQDVAAGTRILLPGGVLPTNERPGYSAPTVSRSSSSSSSSTQVLYAAAGASGNRYSYGYCTWYAYNRRVALGLPVGSNWGNASTWAAYARGAGYQVDHTPSFGAIMQTTGGWGGYGHVAIVESVNPDGSIVVSEMNYVGWNRQSSRVVTNPSAYNFIH